MVVHPDGSIWFTDPRYGIRGNYEGIKGESEAKEAVYRVDGKTAQVDKVTDEVGGPNGTLLFAGLLEAVRRRHGRAARHQGVRRRREDAAQRQAVHPARHSWNRRAGAADGMRCDADGNVWAGARPGVQVIDRRRRAHRHDPPAGGVRERLLRRRARNRLFMTASQSLYAVYVETTGAHFA